MKKISLLLTALLAVVLFYIDDNHGVAHSIKTVLFTVMFLLTCGWLTRHPAGRIIAGILVLFFCMIQGMRFFLWQVYQSGFSETLAETLMATTPAEAGAMTLMYWPYLVVFFAGTVMFYLFCRYIGRSFSARTLRNTVVVFLAYLVISSSLYYFNGKYRSDDFVWGESLTKHSPFYPLGTFFRVHHMQLLINEVRTRQPVFRYDMVNDEIENYVLVIGESARRHDLSLYGRAEDTTPLAVAQQKNMLVFTNAVSPAPVTILSVPASIANVQPGQTGNFADYADNILTLAQSAGLKTYWYSNQGVGGMGYGLIAAISFRAEVTRRNEIIIDDRTLLPDLEAALAQPGRKLIILHLYGSHPPACERTEDKILLPFSGGREENCYLNSVYYTDALLGDITAQLEDSRSSMLYFSDHGMVRKHLSGDTEYVHGIADPVRDSYDIPMYIWYSEKLAGQYPRGRKIESLYSGSADYWLISDWLGLRQHDERRCVSPLSDCYQPPEDVLVMDGNKELHSYRSLNQR
ncbi:phosphoethanolamine transferase [Morganella morganii]|uniref:phosphoethanolamine transferase n=1 Tax=Morganella morganii TaxID=582 RepID=UPI0021D27BF3|nr:phosphoethanolamine transferase [Morganella morganii]MCU6375759.1 phosphoethanolamine transferase [Morganella morganii]